MKKIGLFYAPENGATERIAQMISEKLGEENVEMVLITESTELKDILEYKKLIFGVPTIKVDDLNEGDEKTGWDYLIPKLDHRRFDKTIGAIFGLGNSVDYPENFVDSMGTLARMLVAGSMKLVGKCSTEGYEFTNSAGVINETFVGLPIDEDNEAEKTDGRVDEWLEKIRSNFKL